MTDSACRGQLQSEFAPGRAVESIGQYREYIRNTVQTGFHPAGTCRMDGDDEAMVDPQLKLRGISGTLELLRRWRRA